MVCIGIIGGSGLDDPHILENSQEHKINTPYGNPSSTIKQGKIAGVDVLLLARHGRDHSIMPTNVNNRANIWALKELGCTHILVSTACGSLQEQIKPGDFVFIDQFIDRTTKRIQTFHEQGVVSHIPMAEPFCPRLRNYLINAAAELKLSFHKQGTMVTIEGPRFSSRAESKLFKSWGADLINMSTVPEVVLAREAGIPYAAIAMATDYDSWRESEIPVSLEEVFKTFRENVEKVIALFTTVIPLVEDYSHDYTLQATQALVGGTKEE